MSNIGRNSPQISTPPPAKRSSKKNLDDELFEFLNSEQPANPAKKKLVHSRQSSTGSNRTTDSGLHFTARPQTPAGVYIKYSGLASVVRAEERKETIVHVTVIVLWFFSCLASLFDQLTTHTCFKCCHVYHLRLVVSSKCSSSSARPERFRFGFITPHC